MPYFLHNVFTLPHELNGLILYSQRNQRGLFKLLFDAAAQLLLEFGRAETRQQGRFYARAARVGPATAGPLPCAWPDRLPALADDGSRWIAGGCKFLFPVRGLGEIGAQSVLDGVAGGQMQGSLDINPQLAELANAPSQSSLATVGRNSGWSIRKPRFPGRASCWITSGVIRIAWPSAITACSIARTAKSATTSAIAAMATA